jgi:phage tail tape-measure protein
MNPAKPREMTAEDNEKRLPEKDVVSEGTDPHPVATDVGALAGAAAGALIGSSLGPAGTITGALIGASTGIIAGKGIAVGMEPTAQEAYRQRMGSSAAAEERDFTFEDFSLAFQMGWQAYAPGESFESVEDELKLRWEQEKGESAMTWEQAHDAAKSGWERMREIHHSTPRDPA